MILLFSFIFKKLNVFEMRYFNSHHNFITLQRNRNITSGKMKIKSIFKQTPTLPKETDTINKSRPSECQIQTKYGYTYSDKELDEFSNSIISSNSPPAEKIKKYIKSNIEFLEIQSLNANFDLNQNTDSVKDQICQLFINFNELKRSYDKEIADSSTRINEFLLKEEKNFKQLLENHKIEQNKFDQKWSDPEFSNPVNKSSSNTIQFFDQEQIIHDNQVHPEPDTATDQFPEESAESSEDKISKQKEIEWKDLISSQKVQISKFNGNKYKYLEFIKMENQKRLKSLTCSLNQVKAKGQFVAASKNFLNEIESQTASNTKQSMVSFDKAILNSQKVTNSVNLSQCKSQMAYQCFKGGKQASNSRQPPAGATQPATKTRIQQCKSQVAYLQSYSSTLNLEMSNVFRNNNNAAFGKSGSKAAAKQLGSSLPAGGQRQRVGQPLPLLRKSVFARQPAIRRPELAAPAGKRLSVFGPSKNNLSSAAVRKPSPLKSVSPFQVKKLGDLKEADQITTENNVSEGAESHQDKGQGKNEKVRWVEYDYQYHYNQKFRDNMFFIDYKKYKFSKKNPFTDNGKKKVVYIK